MMLALALVPAALAATVAQLIAQEASLSKLQPLAGAWTGPTSIFVSAGSDQYCVVTSVIDYNIVPRIHYALYNSASTPQRIVFDNYNTDSSDPTSIHIRFGLGDALVQRALKADNGYIYITDIPILPPSTLQQTLAFQGCTLFYNALKEVGLDTLETVRKVTLYAPSDAAFRASNYNSLGLQQKRALLLYHFANTEALSTALNPTQSFNTLLQGNSLPVTVAGEGATVGPQAKVELADIFVATGVIHRISAVLTPPNMPAGTLVVEPFGVTLNAPPSASGKGPSPAQSAGAPQQTNAATAQYVNAIGAAVAALGVAVL